MSHDGNDWTPTHDDLLWLAHMLELLREGGLLVYPATGLMYKVSHKNKTLTLQNPGFLKVPENRKLHEMTKIVAGFFYYEVKEATQ